MMYVPAEQKGDWPLTLTSVKLMLPYFFAVDHPNYARYRLRYLHSVKKMPECVLERFLKGKHVTRHVPGVWNAIRSDIIIISGFKPGFQLMLGATSLFIWPSSICSSPVGLPYWLCSDACHWQAYFVRSSLFSWWYGSLHYHLCASLHQIIVIFSHHMAIRSQCLQLTIYQSISSTRGYIFSPTGALHTSIRSSSFLSCLF